MTSKSPVGDISVVTLIRTDTTLDHSQEAEKVHRERGVPYSIALSCLMKSLAKIKGKRVRNTKGKQEPKGRNHEREASTPGEPKPKGSRNQMGGKSLAAAHKRTASREILLWMTPPGAPKALQTSEGSELLDLMRASDWISVKH